MAINYSYTFRHGIVDPLPDMAPTAPITGETLQDIFVHTGRAVPRRHITVPKRKNADNTLRFPVGSTLHLQVAGETVATATVTHVKHYLKSLRVHFAAPVPTL